LVNQPSGRPEVRRSGQLARALAGGLLVEDDAQAGRGRRQEVNMLKRQLRGKHVR
jgi:hypothetical protein